MSKPKVPNTISDKQMAALRRRAEKTSPARDMFSKREVARRLAGNKQHSKARWS